MNEEANAANENDAESTSSNDANDSETAAENIVSIGDRTDPIDNLTPNYAGQLSSTSRIHEFDLNLPASHSYLGTNLEELRGRIFLDEGIYINLPLVVKPSIVLFPGQTLPMAVYQTYVINMLNDCLQYNRTFGVVCAQDDKTVSIGTTADIYEYLSGTSREGFRLKAKGRQRFRILKLMEGYNKISANVKILPEINLPHPFSDQRLACLDCYRVKPTNEQELVKQNKLEMLESVVTQWPSWVYRQYDPNRLSRKIREQLQFIETKVRCIPTDPVDLSYWVAQNLPLSDSDRLMLLKYDCAISRLQWELNYLIEDRILVCIRCDRQIGKQSNIFPMSKEGPQNTFCNSAGFLHDTVTLRQAENLELNSNLASTHYSWFPGYAWTIASCEGCKIHMGWLFTRAQDKHLRPSSFWGLTRSNLRSKKLSEENKQLSISGHENNQTDLDDEENEDSNDEDNFSIN
ncbi:protein cereblon [Phymastichus coffea]|uniref:protein cereblon n=1 Tax=Phymastichus coffea TaxID=108790 RepID=UPI00273B289F|nr:protein cereblon [Phymastichus coffea]